MRLLQAQVKNFKSIENSGPVTIDSGVTVLVGQNEAGKTAFLQALEKANPARKGIKFDPTEDYPRRSLNEYLRQHTANPADAVILTYELDSLEVKAVNEAMGAEVLKSPQFSVTYKYGGGSSISVHSDERAFIEAEVKNAKLSSELGKLAASVSTVRELIETMKASDLTVKDQEFLDSLEERFEDVPSGWPNVVTYEVYHEYLESKPKFLYFGDYQLLPGKVNLPALQQRVADPRQLTDEDQTVLSLLRMADVDLTDVMATTGYEEAKARLEGLSNSITDQVFEFWTQNRELDVEFDIKADPTDPQSPFNNGGPNLYIRIRNRRHRVTVPFSQRSKGFIWFFSFLVWFDGVKAEGSSAPIILLLDEPGLSLHALAQADLLRYIDSLAARHQVLYTTHSPFMVHGDRLYQVRLVEDRAKEGTVVTDNVMGSDPKTVFPLQAALGYTVAQNLFISKRNLLVEGPADLIYLKFMSALLEEAGREGLRDDITVVPAGGLDKVATFIALLRGNELEMAVVHDLGSKPDTRLESMVREKIIRDRQLLNYGMFRGVAVGPGKKANLPATDVEDLFTPALYLQLFNGTFAKQLGKTKVAEASLPKGDRIIERLEQYLEANTLLLRPSGGFNHYMPASFLASNPPKVDNETLDRFEALFRAVNTLFTR
jgi:hypothetical protein